MLLTKARNHTASRLKQWLRGVTEEGIEPNPGPSTSTSCPTWCRFHLNADGCTNAFETLELFQTFETQPLVCSLARSARARVSKRLSPSGPTAWATPSAQGARQQGPAAGKVVSSWGCFAGLD